MKLLSQTGFAEEIIKSVTRTKFFIKLKGMVAIILKINGRYFGVSCIHMDDIKNKCKEPKKDPVAASKKAAEETLGAWMQHLSEIHEKGCPLEFMLMLGDLNSRPLDAPDNIDDERFSTLVEAGEIPWVKDSDSHLNFRSNKECLNKDSLRYIKHKITADPLFDACFGEHDRRGRTTVSAKWYEPRIAFQPSYKWDKETCSLDRGGYTERGILLGTRVDGNVKYHNYSTETPTFTEGSKKGQFPSDHLPLFGEFTYEW